MGSSQDPEQTQLLVPITYSLEEWEKELQTVLNDLEDIRKNRLGKVGAQEVRADIDQAYNRVHYTHALHHQGARGSHENQGGLRGLEG